MSENTLATTTPATLIDPLILDDAMTRLDSAIDEMVGRAVGVVESEARRHMRRREVAYAVRAILRVRQNLDELTADPGGTDDTMSVLIDGERDDLLAMYRTLNPAVTEGRLAEVVDGVLGVYRDRLKPAGEPAGRKRVKAGKS